MRMSADVNEETQRVDSALQSGVLWSKWRVKCVEEYSELGDRDRRWV